MPDRTRLVAAAVLATVMAGSACSQSSSTAPHTTQSETRPLVAGSSSRQPSYLSDQERAAVVTSAKSSKLRSVLVPPTMPSPSGRLTISDDGTVSFQFGGGTGGFGPGSGITYDVTPDNRPTTTKSVLKICETQRDHGTVPIEIAGAAATGCSRSGPPGSADVFVRRNGEILRVRTATDVMAAEFLRSLTIDVLANP